MILIVKFVAMLLVPSMVLAQTPSSSLLVGPKTNADKSVRFNRNSTLKPQIRWNEGTSKLQFSNDGSAFTDISGGAAPDQSYEINNLALTATVAANALTVAVKSKDLNNPTSGNPVKIGFRSSTAATGTYNQRSITSALSVVVSSGSTLGHGSGLTHFVFVYALDNAGTVELAVSSVLFDDGSIQNTTAEGGTGTADSRHLLYSTTARTGVPVRLIGRVKVNQATAGTWVTSPSEIALAPFGVQDIFAKYRITTNNTVSASSQAIVNYNTRELDSHNSVTTGVSWQFLASRPGVCFVHASLLFGGNPVAADVAFNLQLMKNGSIEQQLNQYRVQSSGSAAYHHLLGTTMIALAANDTIAIQVANGDDSGQDTTSNDQYSIINIYCPKNGFVL